MVSLSSRKTLLGDLDEVSWRHNAHLDDGVNPSPQKRRSNRKLDFANQETGRGFEARPKGRRDELNMARQMEGHEGLSKFEGCAKKQTLVTCFLGRLT